MGWTEYHIYDTPKKELDKLFTWNNEKNSGRVLTSYTKHFTQYYAAVEITKKETNKTEVVAVVCLYHYTPKAYFNFCYKDMDETMLPYYCECPKTILNLLTPTENEMANEWRKRCYARAEKTKAFKNLQSGDKIVFNYFDEFDENNTVKRVELEVFKYHKTIELYNKETHLNWGIDNIPDEYEIIKAE